MFHLNYVGEVGVYDKNFVRLELMSAKGYLGCPYAICDFRTCSVNHHNDFNGCTGEGFQIIGEGGGNIKSGQRVSFRFVREGNVWMGCPHSNHCDKRTCPGSVTSSRARNFNTCWGERFTIYACERNNGDHIQNGDLVMIYFPGNPSSKSSNDKKYISIEESAEGDDTSISTCPGINAPSCFSFSICPKSVFHIHRKP